MSLTLWAVRQDERGLEAGEDRYPRNRNNRRVMCDVFELVSVVW